LVRGGNKRLVILGFDGAMYYFVKHFADEGKLPNFKKLMEEGSYGEVLPVAPVDTPTNWATIVTGAYTGTHGVTSFYIHIPGEPLDYGMRLRSRSQISTYCQAEFLWDVYEKKGLKCAILNYPVAWPPTIKKGVVIGGLNPTNPWRFYRPTIYATSKKLFVELRDWAGKVVGNYVKIHVMKATGWTNVPPSAKPPLESALLVSGETELIEREGKLKPKEGVSDEKIYNLLIYASKEEYDTVLVCDGKNCLNKVAELKVGKWSKWIKEKFSIAGLTDRFHWRHRWLYEKYLIRGFRTRCSKAEGIFRFRLLRISPDGKELAIQRTEIVPVHGWAYPDFFEEKIISEVGPYIGGYENYGGEYAEIQADWFLRVIALIRRELDPDVLIMHYHLLDAINHTYLGLLYPKHHRYSEAGAQSAWRVFEHSYRVLDRIVGEVMRMFPDALTVVVSDHAALPILGYVWIARPFMDEGLLTYYWNEELGKYVVNWKRSKVFPYGEPPFIWINLKGRDPGGIVRSGEEYENLQEQIIDILYDIEDPDTGEKVVALALKKQDARSFGLWGDRVGDVIYFLKPGYATTDGPYEASCCDVLDHEQILRLAVTKSKYKTGDHGSFMPGAVLGSFSVNSILFIKGRGIREGYELKRNSSLVDIVPTISAHLGLPIPKDAEGKILWDIMET